MKNALLIFLCGVALAACASGKEPLLAPLPAEGPLYGITKQGVFFVHDSLVVNAGAQSVKLASQATEWKHRAMEKRGEYYVYDCTTDTHDKALFVFYQNFKIKYAFFIDKQASIPGIFAQNKEIAGSFDPRDLSITAEAGPVFFTKALDDDLRLW